MADYRLVIVSSQISLMSYQEFDLNTVVEVVGESGKKDKKKSKAVSFFADPWIKIDKKGVLTAPEAKGSQKSFFVDAVFKESPSAHGQIEIIVNPVEIVWNDSISVVHAGVDYVDLGIESFYDPNGPKNFKYEFKKGSKGELKEGFYVPPRFVEKEEDVIIELKSNFDFTKKLEIRFKLAPPLCSTCGQQVSSNGNCLNCGKTKYSDPNEGLCDGCKKHKPEGRRFCPHCGYPGPKKNFI